MHATSNHSSHPTCPLWRRGMHPSSNTFLGSHFAGSRCRIASTTVPCRMHARWSCPSSIETATANMLPAVERMLPASTRSRSVVWTIGAMQPRSWAKGWRCVAPTGLPGHWVSVPARRVSYRLLCGTEITANPAIRTLGAQCPMSWRCARCSYPAFVACGQDSRASSVITRPCLK